MFTYTRKTEEKTTHVANVSAVKRDPIHNSVKKFHTPNFSVGLWGRFVSFYVLFPVIITKIKDNF